MNTPWIESPFFEDILKIKELSQEHIQIAKDFNKNGYVTIPNLFSEELIDKIQSETEDKAFNKNFPLTTYRDKTRVQDFWMVSDNCKQLACHPKVLEILEMLYDREAIPFQTLNFSVGTQQGGHSDTIHFSSLPSKYMCGVWVALEDITADNGPLFYYSGSHKLPEYNFSHILNDLTTPRYEKYPAYVDFIENLMTINQFKKQYFYAKKGDALIWSSNIIHGGSKVLKKGSSRWSQVTHYFFKDCIYYTPMLSNMVTNELYLRNDLINIKNGKKVKHSYNGKALHSIQVDSTNSILSNNIKMYLPRNPFKFTRNILARLKRKLIN